MKKQITTIDQLFLEEFVKQLIINSESSKRLNRRIQEIIQKKNFYNLPKRRLLIHEENMPKIRPNIVYLPESLKQNIEKKLQSYQEQKIESPVQQTKPYQEIKQIKQQTQITQAVPQSNLILGKINQLIFDPAVDSIECPGPYKNLLVNKSGAIQATNINLSPEETNEIMEEFSRITKIPISSGVFKGAIGKLIITAVISEFVGTRFIIQKARRLEDKRI